MISRKLNQSNLSVTWLTCGGEKDKDRRRMGGRKREKQRPSGEAKKPLKTEISMSDKAKIIE
jgi:hypothetical protein